MSQPCYPNPLTPEAAVDKLTRACDSGHHVFRPCDLSVTDVERIVRRGILGPNQVTDTYLLALAVHHGDRLVTLDCRVLITSVSGAIPDHLVVV